MIYQIYKDAKGEWRWRLIAPNARIVADSAQGYKNKKDCLSDIELVKQSADAPIVPKASGGMPIGGGRPHGVGHGPGDGP